MGRQYLPRTGLTEFRERGMASWYGRKFHGRNTSSGEPYDMYGLTAAHPTLPIPSYVRVTHVRSARSVVVRVNDRGPFLGDRIIDLSFTAASRLGYLQAGTAEVEVELLASPDGWSPAAMARSAPSLNTPTIESIIEDRLGRGGTAP
jgi:rare lipoprotein A